MTKKLNPESTDLFPGFVEMFSQIATIITNSLDGDKKLDASADYIAAALQFGAISCVCIQTTKVEFLENMGSAYDAAVKYVEELKAKETAQAN